MNWGLKITVLYSGFVILISSLVFISANNKNELVSKDYYAQELQYQERINAIANEKKLALSITHEIKNGKVIITYPGDQQGKDFNGSVLFFRPSDSTKDVKLNLSFSSDGKQIIDANKLSKGVYKLCLSWKNNNTNFYKEEIITI